MIMAMGRLNIPSVLISGGPMLAGRYAGRDIDLITVFEAVGGYKVGKIDEETLRAIEDLACPGAGSCAGLFTANTMNSLAEALGIAPRGNGTVPAVHAKRLRMAKEAGMLVVELVKRNVRPRDIVTRESLMNAIMVDLATGGSTNTVLHLKAIAESFEIDFDIRLFDELSRKVPHICNISPVGPYHIQDLDEAGGIYAVMKRLQENNLLKEDAMTIYLRKIGDLVREAKIMNEEVIRPFDNPIERVGLEFSSETLPRRGQLPNSPVSPKR